MASAVTTLNLSQFWSSKLNFMAYHSPIRRAISRLAVGLLVALATVHGCRQPSRSPAIPANSDQGNGASVDDDWSPEQNFEFAGRIVAVDPMPFIEGPDRNRWVVRFEIIRAKHTTASMSPGDSFLILMHSPVKSFRAPREAILHRVFQVRLLGQFENPYSGDFEIVGPFSDAEE